MEQTLLLQFQQLIAARTGLQIRAQEREALQKTLAARAKTLQFSGLEKYHALLAGSGAQSESEWKQLIALLTNQESYFFRDKGQFALLQERILPELIHANRHRRKLRLWSAGCSTGEEPYSLAMLVDQLLPRRENWDISILGTDIKEGALEKARLGIYSPWSFRLVEPDLQQRYFQGQQTDYKLDARIRSMVTFRPSNLFQDDFPNAQTGFYGIDLILCRNVFIYFEENAVSVVLNKFAATLRLGGYLMTGHAELSTQKVPLETRVLPGSVIYQRGVQPIIAPSIQTEPVAAWSTPAAAITPEIKKTPVFAAPPPAAPIIKKIESAPPEYSALCQSARNAANSGRHEAAIQFCRQAIALDAFAPVAYSLLAHIAEEQGDSEEAVSLLKKVIYLAPTFIAAYLELGELHAKAGDATRAQKMRASALELLQSLTPQTVVEPYALTAQEMIGQLQSGSVG